MNVLAIILIPMPMLMLLLLSLLRDSLVTLLLLQLWSWQKICCSFFLSRSCIFVVSWFFYSSVHFVTRFYSAHAQCNVPNLINVCSCICTKTSLSDSYAPDFIAILMLLNQLNSSEKWINFNVFLFIWLFRM